MALVMTFEDHPPTTLVNVCFIFVFLKVLIFTTCDPESNEGTYLGLEHSIYCKKKFDP